VTFTVYEDVEVTASDGTKVTIRRPREELTPEELQREIARLRAGQEWGRRVNAEFLKRLRVFVGGAYNMTWVTRRARGIVMTEVLREAPPDPRAVPLFEHLWPLFPKKWAGGERDE
jgi:hypothetical protein